MIFTREDILKILNALLQLGRKDSEFKEANTPLNSDDYIAILQDGINKKVSINNLLSTLGVLKKDDFINISDRYDEYYIQLSEAITIIANNKRKKGLVITFQDINGTWKIYQFNDEVSNFTKTEYWKDLFDFKYPIINTVLPDEEDLTLTYPNIEGNSFIKLKDKDYDPDGFSGKGYKILRKNLTKIGDKIINLLTQEMINKSNTIYEIRYDFDLNGEEINLNHSGKTVILDFKGGSLKNGFIQCNGQSQLIGQVKLDHVQFTKQSLKYRPFNYGNDFNLLWFYTGNIGNQNINFNDVYDNFLYSLGDWKSVGHIHINLSVPSSSIYYIVTRPIYVPNWVSINFNHAILNVPEENELNGDFVIRVNVNDTKFEQDEQYIDWVAPYPKLEGFLKNLRLSGYIYKGILALDNRRYDNIKIVTTINDTNFIAFDQYPEAGKRLYLDATYITRMATSMPTDTKGNTQYGWVKLGFGDAAVLTQMLDMRLFIYNRQSFTIDGGIQCYPYVVCSIGNIRNLHNEFPYDINIAFSRVSFYDCIFYRKTDTQNVNIINITSNNKFELPFNVSMLESSVTYNMSPGLTLNSCIFAYNYKYTGTSSFDYYDIYSDCPRGNKIYVNAINTYAVSYGYGKLNSVVYKLRCKSAIDGLFSIFYNEYSDYIPLVNLLGVQLSVNTREKNDIDGGTIISGDTYTYYTAISFGDRPVILRSPAIVCTANSNWNLLGIGYYNNATNTYLIRVHNGEYHILKLDLLPLFYGEYTEAYSMDYGDYMNNRRKWEPYSEDLFNKLVEIDNTTLKTDNWSYNSIIDSFKYSTNYSIKSQSTNIAKLSSLIPLNYNDKAVCNGNNSKYNKEEYRFKGNILIDINTNLPIGVKNIGTFNQKPTSKQNIEIGFAYFCTDKRASESENDGIMIYYKGNDVWIDALGRVVE